MTPRRPPSSHADVGRTCLITWRVPADPYPTYLAGVIMGSIFFFFALLFCGLADCIYDLLPRRRCSLVSRLVLRGYWCVCRPWRRLNNRPKKIVVALVLFIFWWVLLAVLGWI